MSEKNNNKPKSNEDKSVQTIKAGSREERNKAKKQVATLKQDLSRLQQESLLALQKQLNQHLKGEDLQTILQNENLQQSKEAPEDAIKNTQEAIEMAMQAAMKSVEEAEKQLSGLKQP